MQLLPQLQLVREALVEVVEQPKEYPSERDDQLVEDCVELKSLDETHLYEPNDSRLS